MSLSCIANKFYEYDHSDIKTCLLVRAREEGLDETSTVISAPVDLREDEDRELPCRPHALSLPSSRPTTMLIPMNLSYRKWAGLVIEIGQKNIAKSLQYFDPLGNNGIKNSQLCELSKSLGVVCAKQTLIKRPALLRVTSVADSGPITIENLISARKKHAFSALAHESVMIKARSHHIDIMGDFFGSKQKCIFNEWSQKQVLSLSWDAQVNDCCFRFPPSRLLALLSKREPPHIILLGKSGAGKGTLSQMLADRYGYVHISIGDIHRHKNQKGTKTGLKIQELVAHNKVGSPEMAEITYAILNKKIHDIFAKNKMFIFDNFPTFPIHVPFITQMIAQHTLEKRVILIVPEISDEAAIARLENRVVCSSPDCGRSYNLESVTPKTEGKCDSCNAKLVRRIDDTADIIKNKRMPFYRANILPSIRLLAEKIDFFFIREIFDLFARNLHLFPNKT